MTRRGRLLIDIRSISLVITLVFCGSSLSNAAEKEMSAYKMGGIFSVSGSYGPHGIGCFRGIEIAADKINEEGGIKVGDRSYVIRLINADAKSDFNVALVQANRLIFNENINYILGPMMSGETLAILPVTEANKTLVFSTSFTPKVLGKDKKYSFRLMPSGIENANAIFVHLIKNQINVKTIATLGPNDETGWGVAEHEKKMAEQHGMKVVFEDFFQRGTDDFFPVLTKMMTKNPDLLLANSIPPHSMGLLLSQKHQLGYKGLIMSPSYYDPEKLLAKAGVEAVEGLIHQSPDFQGQKASSGHRELYKRFITKYKEEILPVSALTYPWLFVIKMAIEKAGTFETTKVVQVLENLEGESPFGRFHLGGLKTYGSKHQIVLPTYMSVIEKGKNVGIDPITIEVP